MAGKPKVLVAQVGNEEKEVQVESLGEDSWRIVIGHDIGHDIDHDIDHHKGHRPATEHIVDARRLDKRSWSLLIDGQAWVAGVDSGKDGSLVTEMRGITTQVKLIDPRRRALAGAARRVAVLGPEAIRAPIPGKIVKVLVKDGEKVVGGQGLLVVEAMKMENELKAPRSAAVKVVHVREGQAVEAQELLLTLE